MSHWTSNYFSPIYNRVYSGPLYQEGNTELEVEFLERHFTRVLPDPLVDIGCAFGRHLKLLKKNKFPVVGLERFYHLLEDHPKRGRRLVCGDTRKLPFLDGAAGGVYCLFNSFGYYERDDNQEILNEWGRVLKPGGRAIFQIPNGPVMADITRDFAPQQMLTGNFTMTETYEIVEDDLTMQGRGCWEFGPEKQYWEFRMKLYTMDQIVEGLAKAGMKIIECFEDYDESDFDIDDSAEMVLVCEKA